MFAVGCGNYGNAPVEEKVDEPQINIKETIPVDEVKTQPSTHEERTRSSKYFIGVPPEDTSLYITINEPCAVIFGPDSTYIAEAKERLGEEDFYIVADDNIWYQAQSIGLIDTLGIKKIYPDKRIINFKGEYEDYVMDLTNSDEGWIILLFNKRGYPFMIDQVGTTLEQYKEYMGIKE